MTGDGHLMSYLSVCDGIKVIYKFIDEIGKQGLGIVFSGSLQIPLL